MKHVVHVTVTYSVEVDDDQLVAEFGKTNKKLVLEVAKHTAGTQFDCVAKVIESYSVHSRRLDPWYFAKERGPCARHGP